jgi:serine/threonine protein kinase/WD40 repeat protein
MSAAPPNERDLFLQAMALPAGERASFLNTACGSNSNLRERVLELLREEEELGGFLESPALGGNRPGRSGTGPSGTELIASVTEREGDRIGRYKLLQRIGEGGCGVVYMAEQEEPVRRRVALKVIKLGMDTRSVIARFEAERQALAMMDHPNIAKVLDAGATDTGRPYFVMELVRGTRITDYCDQHSLPTDARLSLFSQVCHALHHAHQKGIIHRDIKPSNILVTLHDGRPVPKVIDFGIAKATDQRLTDKTLFTEFTTFIGTPAYMSPEQAEMSGLDIDTRSDIYSLGVLLYELLTGKTPFDPETLLRASLDECRRTIREDEPLRPSTRVAAMLDAEMTTTARMRRTETNRLIHQLQGDLDWIVMMCLDKDRTRRYASANDLALDIGRFLESEPVEARPPSNLYRLRKLLHRHRGAFAAAAAIMIILIAGATLSTWLAIRATRAERQARSGQVTEANLRQQAESERTRAERESSSARLNEYIADINLAQRSLADGNLGRALQLLIKHRPAAGEMDLRGFEWRYLWQLCQGDEHTALPDQESPVHCLAFGPAGQWLAIGKQAELSIYNLASRTLVTNLPKGGLSMAVAPDGRFLVAASPSTTRVWDTTTWTERKSLPENLGPVSVSADGRRLSTLTSSGVTVWDTETWEVIETLPDALPPMTLAPDGQAVVAGSISNLVIHSWGGRRRQPLELADSTNVFFRVGPPFARNRPRTEDSSRDFFRLYSRMQRFSADNGLSYSPDGKFVTAARNSLSEFGVFVVSIWDTQTGVHSVMPDDPDHVEHTGSIEALAFAPDGHTLATASADHSIRIWNFDSRRRVMTLQGHVSEVWSIAFSPDGRTIASGAKDGSVRLWPIRTREDVIPGTWSPLAFSKDGRTLAALNKERTLVFLNLATAEAEEQFPLDQEKERGRPFRFNFPLALSANLRMVAYSLGGDTLHFIDTLTQETNSVKTPDPSTESLFLTSDAKTLITSANRGRTVRIWDLAGATNSILPTEAGRLLLSADDRSLAVVTRSNEVQIWDLPTQSIRVTLSIDAQPTMGMAFSNDGRLFAFVGPDDAVRIYDTIASRLLGTCTGHKQRVWSVAFTPDSRTLATVSDDSTLKLWNVPTQQELLTIRRLGGTVRELLFSPDGRMLVGSRGLQSRTSGLRFYLAPHDEEIDGKPSPRKRNSTEKPRPRQ